MERKPQQQTLSIRVSDTLREFLERSKQVISAARGESVSISDVAKTLLESAKEDRLDDRLEAAELGRHPSVSLVELRHKWRAGQPWSRAEWIFVAQYIQVACEELTEDPMAPGVEPFVVLLQAFLSVRGIRSERGTGLDHYYLGNLEESSWNERTLGPNIVPDAVAKLIENIRAVGSGKKAVGVGRNLYVAIRDEDIVGMAALNGALTPFMPTLFQMAARGHWIREKQPLSLPDSALQLLSVPLIKRDHLWISVQPGNRELTLAIGIDSRDLICTLDSYPQIREFAAMLKTLVPEETWHGRHFHARAERSKHGIRYEFRGRGQGIVVGFTAEQWEELKSAYLAMLDEPAVRQISDELSWMYGVI